MEEAVETSKSNWEKKIHERIGFSKLSKYWEIQKDTDMIRVGNMLKKYLRTPSGDRIKDILDEH